LLLLVKRTPANLRHTGNKFQTKIQPFFILVLLVDLGHSKFIRMDIGFDTISIRTIEEKDNRALAFIIRKTLEEFGANHPGTVYYDESTDHLFQVFNSTQRSVYFVAENANGILGGGGIFPTEGLPQDTCELVKMYLLPEARGRGLGSKLIQLCIDFAKQSGYKNIYLETMPELKKALATYEAFGFRYLDGPMGNSGHHGCELWMMKELRIKN
jgi:putative acetyltransferase